MLELMDHLIIDPYQLDDLYRKQVLDDKARAFVQDAFFEGGLLTVCCWVAVLFHPGADAISHASAQESSTNICLPDRNRKNLNCCDCSKHRGLYPDPCRAGLVTQKVRPPAEWDRQTRLDALRTGSGSRH
jgi:hypothetical protein